jgi:Ankyrin repeats (3 copies)
MSASVVPSTLQVDYDKNITNLYKAITQSKWDDAIQAAKENPDEAKTWVVRHYEDNNGGGGEKEIMWRFLPIHSACARQPPASVITALLDAYPDGAKCVDDQGMYALHYACGNQATREVIRLLLMAYPDAAKKKDPRGMLPIHYIACWGPSSISVVDMVLVANRDVADARDEDGNTALDLAKDGEYPERDAVVAALRRWLDNSNSSTTRSAMKPASKSLASFEEKKEEDIYPNQMYSMPRSAPVSSTQFHHNHYLDKITQLEERINELENASKNDQYLINELRGQLNRQEGDMEVSRRQYENAYNERDGLRQTLADLTEQHDKFKKRSEILGDRLGSMNASLLTMMEQQDVVLSAMKAREEQWQALSDLRREKLKELVSLEEQETVEEVELRSCLMKQTKEMEAIKAVIAAVRHADEYR